MAGKNIDLLNGPIAKKIFFFAMPLAFSSILQQLFNTADVAIAGQFAGADALAAVGSNTSVVSLFVNAFVGLAIGANVIIAQYIGNNNKDKISGVVHTSILFGAIIGIVLLLVGQIIAAPLLTLMGAPAEVLDDAVVYLRIYFLGMPFAAVYNFGAAVLRSTGDTKRPMYCLIISGVLNVGLNLLTVIVFGLGVAGVAISTSIANGVSCVLVILILMHEKSEIRLDLRKLRMEADTIKQIVRIGGPAAVQSMVFSLSNICIQSGVNSFGSEAIAGNSITFTFEGFDYFMVSAYNQAAVTFMGQNFAARKTQRCKKIIAYTVIECLICIGIMIAVFVGFQDFWFSLYTSDPVVVEYAKIRMGIVVVLHFMICSYELFGSILRGMGWSMTPAVITIIGSVVFRVIWLLTVFKANHTFLVLTYVYPVSWLITGTMMITAFIIIVRRIKRQQIAG